MTYSFFALSSRPYISGANRACGHQYARTAECHVAIATVTASQTQAMNHCDCSTICCTNAVEQIIRGRCTDVAHFTSSFCCSDQHVQGSNLAQAVG